MTQIEKATPFTYEQSLCESMVAGFDEQPSVCTAFQRVPKSFFWPDTRVSLDNLYWDEPKYGVFEQFGEEQILWMTKPSVLARMLSVLDGRDDEVVAYVGAASGYGACVAAQMSGWVYGIEQSRELTNFARNNARNAGVENVDFLPGDVAEELPRLLSVDVVIVTAGIAVEGVSQMMIGLDGGVMVVAPVFIDQVGSGRCQLQAISRKGFGLDFQTLDDELYGFEPIKGVWGNGK